MNAILPIIEELADAPDDLARATWLMQCPFSVLMTYQSTIRNRLLNAHFLAGVVYVEAVMVVLRAVRDPFGDPTPVSMEILTDAYAQMISNVAPLPVPKN